MDFFVKKTTTASGLKTVLIPSVSTTVQRLHRIFNATLGQTIIQLADNLGVSQEIDVYVNGQNKNEGAGEDFTRDATLNQIIFNNGLQADAKVKVVLYI